MIKIGTKVNHKIFGEGVITDVLMDPCVSLDGIVVRMKFKGNENETAWISWGEVSDKGFALEGTEEYKNNLFKQVFI